MNVHSYAAARQSIAHLELAGANLSKSLGRLSSGMKVAKSEDDAGGLAVSAKLNSVIARSIVLGENVQNGLSFLETQDAAQERLGAIITRMAELRQRFNDTIRNAQDGTIFNLEFKELKEELRSIGKKKFNGVSLFSNESDAKSKLIISTAADGRSSSSAISRNLFFNSVMETASTGGSVGDSRITQASFGSFSGTITPTGGTTPDQTVSGAGGSTPDQTVKGSQGATPNRIVNGSVGGTAPDQTVKGSQGATPDQTVNGAQGSTPAQNAKATGLPIGSSEKWNFSSTDSSTFFQRSDPKLGPDGMVYAGGRGDPIYRIDPETGTVLQTYDAAGLGDRPSSPAFSPAGNVIYFGGKDNRLHAFDLATGTELWTAPMSHDGDGTPAVDPVTGDIYMGDDNGRIYKFDSNGNSLWPTPPIVGDEANSTPVLSADRSTLYIMARRIYAIDTGTGGIDWQSPPLTNFNINYAGVAVNPTDGSIVGGGRNGRVRAHNPDGSNKWATPFNTGGRIESNPAITADGSVVYVGSRNGNLFALDAGTGTEKWRFDTGDDIYRSSPTIGQDGTVYVAGHSGEVFALRDNGSSVSQLWNRDIGMDIESDLLVVGSSSVTAGTLFVGSGTRAASGNSLVAIESQYTTPANLSNIGSGYDPTEAAPTVTITGGDKGDLAGTASVNPDGTLNISFTGNPTGTGNLSVTIANGVMRNPANLSGLGSGYAPTEAAPSVTISGANANTLAGTASINADGTLDVTFDPLTQPNGTGNLTVAIANGVFQKPADLTSIGSGYNPAEPAPAVTFTAGNAATLAGTATINADGTLNIAFSGAPGDTNNLTMAIADGRDKPPANLSGIGSGYDPSETAPAVTVTGLDTGTLAGTSSINPDGTIDITFAGNPSDIGNLTVAVAAGVFQKPANLTSIGSGYDPAEPAPAVTFTAGNAGTLAGTPTINADGTLNVSFAGVPGDANNLTLAVADGRDKPPANLSGIGSGYDPAEANPAVAITGADAGTLTGTSSINLDGTLDVTFSGNPSDVGNLTVAVADGVLQKPADLTSIGSGYDPAEVAPAVTFTAGSPGTLVGTSSINGDGTLDVTFSGVPGDANNLTVAVANGLPGVSNLSGIGSGYTLGDPGPSVTIPGANAGTLAGNSSINPDGTLDITFTGNPLGIGNLTVQVADGLARVSNLSGVGGSYDPAEIPPNITITGANANTLAGTSSINPDGTLNITFSGNSSNFGSLAIQAADGNLRAPLTLSGMGANHDSTTPPAVTISGNPTDVGTLAGIASVNPDKTVDVSFTGTPSGQGPLTVQIPGGVSSDPVSKEYLLSIDGNIWDYSVAEFEAFTELIADARAQNGAEQNSLNTDWNRLSAKIGQLEAAKGRITDTDFAAEVTELGKSQILGQSSATLLAKHNRITTEALLTLQRLGTSL